MANEKESIVAIVLALAFVFMLGGLMGSIAGKTEGQKNTMIALDYKVVDNNTFEKEGTVLYIKGKELTVIAQPKTIYDQLKEGILNDSND